MGNSSKDVIAKVHHLRDALETNGNPFTIVDIAALDPREALHDMGNSSKVGVGIVLVTREALKTNGNPFFTGNDVNVCYPLGKPSINIGNPFG